jgi:hypothetical protein
VESHAKSDQHDRSLNSEKSSPQKEKQNQSLESDHFETSYSSEMGNRSFGGNLSMDSVKRLESRHDMAKLD